MPWKANEHTNNRLMQLSYGNYKRWMMVHTIGLGRTFSAILRTQETTFRTGLLLCPPFLVDCKWIWQYWLILNQRLSCRKCQLQMTGSSMLLSSVGCTGLEIAFLDLGYYWVSTTCKHFEINQFKVNGPCPRVVNSQSAPK